MKEIQHEQEGFCGPIALQWVAKQEHIETTQSELARMMNTTHENGTGHNEMFCGAIAIGLKPIQVQGMRIDALAEVLPDFHVIVNWMEDLTPDGGHYSVLKEIKNGKVYLEENEMDIEEFDKRWYDFEEGNVKVEKWALIIKRGK